MANAKHSPQAWRTELTNFPRPHEVCVGFNRLEGENGWKECQFSFDRQDFLNLLDSVLIQLSCYNFEKGSSAQPLVGEDDNAQLAGHCLRECLR